MTAKKTRSRKAVMLNGKCGPLPMWRSARLKDCFSYGKGLNITKADLVEDGAPVVSYGQIHAKQNDGTHLKGELLRYVPDEVARENPGARLKVGDIVFADTSEDLAGVGNCVLNDVGNGVYAGYHTLIARAKDPRNSKYLSYLFQTDCWREQLRKRACGIKVFSLTQRLLSNVKVVLPSCPEQRRITAFLDEKCAAVDKAIEVKRKQLESLEAIWKNVLYHATTQGVDGIGRDARPQDIAGDGGHAGRMTLPSGWRCARLKDCFSYGKGLNITKADLVEDGAPVISYGQIHAKQNDGTHLKGELLRYVPDEVVREYPGARLQVGDIVFADTSEDLDGIGNCVINDVGDVVYAGYHTLIARARDPRNSKYLSYLFQTDCWREQLRKRACGIKVFSLTQRLLSNVKVLLPPQDEQKLIVQYLDARHNELESLAANLQKQIETLEQYRKSLIHEYVTGVRRVV